MKYEIAKSIATDIVEWIEPFCSIINIAGSIRRENAQVKDIEIVALPKYKTVLDLFGVEISRTRHTNFIAAANSIGKVIKGNSTDGKYMQIEVDCGNGTAINLDLFMPNEEDYYRQLAIRTGSAEYAHKVIATAWIKKGWCGSDKGFVLQSECITYFETATNKRQWRCQATSPTKPPHWQSEEHFFEWLGVPFVEPKNRNI